LVRTDGEYAADDRIVLIAEDRPQLRVGGV